jgi:hypothetical protein
VRDAQELRLRRKAIREEVRRLAADKVTLGWAFWSQTMIEGLTTDLVDCYKDIICEELPGHKFFQGGATTTGRGAAKGRLGRTASLP